jgi:hypothetical protein
VGDDPTSREATKKLLADIKKEAGKLTASHKLALKRFSAATASGQALAEDAKASIDSNLKFLELIQRFLNLLLMPQPPLDDFSIAMYDMTVSGVRFTKSLHKYAYWLKARSLLVFERYDELCEMSDMDKDLEKLLVCHMPRSDVKEYASIVLQQCISERLTALKEDQVGRPLAQYREKKVALLMLAQVKTNVTRDGFTGVDIVPNLNKWIAVLDLDHADPFVVCDLAADHAANPERDFPPTDILGQLLHTTKLGIRLLDLAAAWVKDEGETMYVKQCISKVDSLIAQLLKDKPNIADIADGMPEGVLTEDYIAFFDACVVPIEKLVEEVLNQESVSDKVALKTNKKLASLVKKLENRRTELWDYVRKEFFAYVKEAIATVTRLVSEAIEKNGEALHSEGYELVNTEEIRNALAMPGLEKQSVVSHRVVDNASKVAFCSVVKNTGHLLQPWQIMIGALCITGC